MYILHLFHIETKNHNIAQIERRKKDAKKANFRVLSYGPLGHCFVALKGLERGDPFGQVCAQYEYTKDTLLFILIIDLK